MVSQAVAPGGALELRFRSAILPRIPLALALTPGRGGEPSPPYSGKKPAVGSFAGVHFVSTI